MPIFSNVSPVTSASPNHDLMVESLPANTFAADGDSVDLCGHYAFSGDGWLQLRVDGAGVLATAIGAAPQGGVKFSAGCLVTLDVRLTRVGESLLVEPRFASNTGEQGSGELSNGFLAATPATSPVLVGTDFNAAIPVYSHIVDPQSNPIPDGTATQYTFRAVKA